MCLIDYDQVIKGLVKMKQPHMAEFHKHDGSLKQPFELTDEQSRAIKKWEVTNTVTKIERYDKLEANETPWSCYGGKNGVCYGLDDCHHRASMAKAPEWLLKLIARYRDKNVNKSAD